MSPRPRTSHRRANLLTYPRWFAVCSCPFADSNQHRVISIILTGPPRRRPDYPSRAEGGASMYMCRLPQSLSN